MRLLRSNIVIYYVAQNISKNDHAINVFASSIYLQNIFQKKIQTGHYEKKAQFGQVTTRASFTTGRPDKICPSSILHKVLVYDR